MTATAEETGCQLASKLHLWHRDLGCKHLEKVVLFFWLTRKTFMNFPLKHCLVQVSASRKGIITVFQVRPLRRMILFKVI